MPANRSPASLASVCFWIGIAGSPAICPNALADAKWRAETAAPTETVAEARMFVLADYLDALTDPEARSRIEAAPEKVRTSLQPATNNIRSWFMLEYNASAPGVLVSSISLLDSESVPAQALVDEFRLAKDHLQMVEMPRGGTFTGIADVRLLSISRAGAADPLGNFVVATHGTRAISISIAGLGGWKTAPELEAVVGEKLRRMLQIERAVFEKELQ